MRTLCLLAARGSGGAKLVRSVERFGRPSLKAGRVAHIQWTLSKVEEYLAAAVSLLRREQFPGLDAEDVCDVEESFVEQSASPVFDLNEHVPRYARFERERFLCQPLLDAQRPNSVANRLAVSGPCLQTARVDLGWACGHLLSTR